MAVGKVAIGAAISVSAAKAAAVTAAAQAVAINLGIMALSYGAQYLMAKDTGMGGVDPNKFQVNGTSTATYLPVIYGKSKIGINRIFIEQLPDSDEQIVIIGAFAHGKIKKIKKIYFNDDVFAKDDNGTLEIDDDFYGSGYYSKVEYRKGGSSPSPYWWIAEDFENWSTKHRGRYVASIGLQMQFDQDVYPGGLPKVTLKVQGKKDIWDPRDGDSITENTKYTTNLMLCALDYIMSDMYGLGVKKSEIDVPSFIAEANYCDEIIKKDFVDPPASKIEKVKRVKRKTSLTTGTTYRIKYTYAKTTTSYLGISYRNEPNIFNNETDSSPSASFTVSENKYEAKATIPSVITEQSSDEDKLESIQSINLYISPTTDTDYLSSSNWYLFKTIDYDYEDEEDGNQELHFSMHGISDSDIADSDTIYSDIDSNTTWEDGEEPNKPSTGVTIEEDTYGNSLENDKWYRYKTTWKNANGETTASPRSKAVKCKNNKKMIKLTGFPETDDESVTGLRLYRTTGMSDKNGDDAYYHVTDLDVQNGEVTWDTYIDDISDGSLGGEPSTTNTATGGEEKRYTCNGILDTSREVINNLETLIFNGRVMVYWEAGKYRARIKKATVPESFELNEDNIIGDWSFKLPGTNQMFNVIRASFTDRTANYQTNYITFPGPKHKNEYLIRQNRFKNMQEIDLPYVIDKKRAKRIAKVVRDEAQQSIVVSPAVKEEALKLRIGSLVKVTHSTPGWTGKKFWVDGMSLGMDAKIYPSLTEYIENAYDEVNLAVDLPDDTDTDWPSANEVPDEVSGVIITEQLYVDKDSSDTKVNVPMWRLKVSFTEPTDYFWNYSEVYLKTVDAAGNIIQDYEFYKNIYRTHNGVFYIYPVEAFVTYYLKILSVSNTGVKHDLNDEDEVTEYSYTITKTAPEQISGIDVVNRGLDSYTQSDGDIVTPVYGKDFSIRWQEYQEYDDSTTDNAQAHGQTSNPYERFRYKVSVFHSDYPSTTTPGGQKLSTIPIEEVFLRTTNYTYGFEQNIEDSKELWKDYKNNSTWGSAYNSYYGIPQRQISFEVTAIDLYGQESKRSSRITVYNPPAFMLDSNEDLLEIDGEPIKNGVRLNWQHPYREYDIDYFYVKYIKAQYWVANAEYQVNDVVFAPQTQTDGKSKYEVWVCGVAGTSGGSTPDWDSEEGGYGSYPPVLNGVLDGGVQWTKIGSTEFFENFENYTVLTSGGARYSLSTSDTADYRMKTKIVASLVNVSSTDGDISNAQYTLDVYKLDPKYPYFFGILCHDAFGKDTSQNYNYAYQLEIPGQTADDEEDGVEKPATPSFSGIAAANQLTDTSVIMADGSTLNRLTLKVNKNTEEDIEKYVFQFIGLAKSNESLANMPTTSEIDAGIKTISMQNYQVTLDEIEVKYWEDSSSYIYGHLKGVETGWTYYARVKAINTSGLRSPNTTVSSDHVLSPQGDTDGLAIGGGEANDTTLSVTSLSTSLSIVITVSNPEDDLWGAKIAVKPTTGFSDAATAINGDRETNKVAEIASKAGKIEYSFPGDAGVDYYVSVLILDNSKNPSTISSQASWLDASSSPYQVSGISHEELGTSFQKYRYKGLISAVDENHITWSSETLKLKGRTNVSITGETNQLVTGTMVLAWPRTSDGSKKHFELIDYDDFYDDPTYDDSLTIAFVEAAASGQECLVIPTTGTNFIVSASILAANSVIASKVKAGEIDASKLNISDLVDISGVLTLSDADEPRIYLNGNPNPPVIRISKDGFDASSETGADNLLFSSEFNYFKIDPNYSGSYSGKFSTISVGHKLDGTEEFVLETLPDSITDFLVVGYLQRSSGQILMLPFTQIFPSNTDGNPFVEIIELEVISGYLRLRKKYYNGSDSLSDDTTSFDFTCYYYLLAQTGGN